MTTQAHHPDLTGAAQRLLDDYVGSIRESLVHEAQRPYEAQVAPQVTVDDLRGALWRYRTTADDARAARLRKRSINWQIPLSVVGVIVGTLSGVAANLFAEGSSSQYAALAVGLAVTFAILAGASAVLAERHFDRRVAKDARHPAAPNAVPRDNPLRIAFDVALLEAAARTSIAAYFGESRADVPLNEMPQHLKQIGTWTDSDVAIFVEIMRFRNDLLHKGTQPLDQEAGLVVDEARRLLAKLSGRA